MKELVLPLVGELTQRNIDPINFISKDQRFIGCTFSKSESQLAGQRNIWVNKRSGFVDASITIDSGKTGAAIADTHNFLSYSSAVASGPCMAFIQSGVPSTLLFYANTTYIGTYTTSAPAVRISALTMGGLNIFVIVVVGGGVFWIGDTGMAGAGVTFTGDTHTNTTIDNISSATGLVKGQKISGTNIVAGTRITNISGSTLTIDTATTGSTNGVTITRERMAKIIDSDFPTAPAGYMCKLDGYFFIADSANGRIYQSAVDDLTSWAAADYLTVDSTPGALLGVARSSNRIVAIKTDCVENYYNNGNISGSILTVDQPARSVISQNVGVWSTTIVHCPIYAVDDYVFHLADKVYVTRGNVTKPVSNEEIDRWLAIYDNDTLFINGFKMNGNIYLHIYINAGGFSILYDMNNNIWSESGFGASYPIISESQGFVIYAKADGKLHYYPYSNLSRTPVYQDDGVAYTMTVQTNRMDFGYIGWKTLWRIDMLADTQSSGTATMEYSIDDGANWTTMSTFDMTAQHKFMCIPVTFEGQIQLRLTHAANTPFRASALKLSWTQGNT